MVKPPRRPLALFLGIGLSACVPKQKLDAALAEVDRAREAQARAEKFERGAHFAMERCHEHEEQ